MIKTIININVLSFTFLIVLCLGITNVVSSNFQSGEIVSQSEPQVPEPDRLQETYLKGNKEEKSLQCSEEVA